MKNSATAASKKLTFTHVLDSSRVIGLNFMNSSGLPFSVPKCESQKSCCSRSASNHEQHMQMCSRMSIGRSFVHSALREVMCTFGIHGRAAKRHMGEGLRCYLLRKLLHQQRNPKPYTLRTSDVQRQTGNLARSRRGVVPEQCTPSRSCVTEAKAIILLVDRK